MARAPLNSGLVAFRGRVGDLIYKRYGDKIVVTRVPRFSGKWSAKQRAGRRAFGQASRYAEKVFADPALKARYAHFVKRRKLTIRPAAIRDFLTSPKIARINRSRYHGQVGDLIFIEATALLEVVAVHVTIRNAQGRIVERGLAARRADWVYTATMSVPPDDAGTIEVTATGLPGNTTTRTA